MATFAKGVKKELKRNPKGKLARMVAREEDKKESKRRQKGDKKKILHQKGSKTEIKRM